MSASTAADGSLPDWLLGTILGGVSSLTVASAMTLFKVSADQEKGRPLWCRPRWGAGFVAMMVDSVVLVPMTVSLAPVALLAPLSALGIFFSLILARVFLQERLPCRSVGIICIMLAGITDAAAFGPHPDRIVTLEEMYARGLTPIDVIILSLFLGIIITDLVLKNCPALRKFRPPEQSVRWSFLAALAASSCSSITSTCLKVITAAVRAKNEAGSMDPIYSSLPLVPTVVVGLVVTAPLLLYEINSSLGAAQASYAIPVYKSLNIINGILLAGLIWREFDGEPPDHVFKFLVGMVTIIVSVGLLSFAEVEFERRKQQQRGDDYHLL